MMKLLFWSGVFVGLFGTLAAVSLIQWVDHPRLRAHITVQPNGGAQETFVIRLPRDRIVDTGSPNGLPPMSPADLVLPDTLVVDGQIEQFKLRDREGEVIGVAARHSLPLGDRMATGWVLFLPGRGSLLLRHVESAGGLAGQLAQRGLRVGSTWNGEVTLTRTQGPVAGQSGEVRGGSAEFENRSGTYTETWHLTGMDDQGVLRGTIELNTTTVRAQ